MPVAFLFLLCSLTQQQAIVLIKHKYNRGHFHLTRIALCNWKLSYTFASTFSITNDLEYWKIFFQSLRQKQKWPHQLGSTTENFEHLDI